MSVKISGGVREQGIIVGNLYDKYGFKEAVLDSQKYERGNVKMILEITT